MKKLIFFISLLILSSGNILSQIGWFWQNPYPVGSHLEDCFFVNENTGYAVGWDGVIIKTINGGINWDQKNSNTNLLLYSVYFINSSTGFVVSGDPTYSTNGVILKTINGGDSWSQTKFNNISFVSVYFVNESTGFAAGNYDNSSGRLFKTTNSGINWNQMSNIPPSFFSSIFFLDENSGYVSNEQSFIKTTNCGINWTEVGLNQVTGIQNIFFTSLNTGFATGYYGKIFKTTNGGNNWNLTRVNGNTHLWSVKFLNSNTGFIAGGGNLQNLQGRLYKTSNSGLTWDSIIFGNNQNLVGLSVNNNNIIATGYSGFIVKSTNNGIDWNVCSSGQSNIKYNHISFYDINTGYITGSLGTILKTSNNGSSWVTLNIGSNVDLNKTIFINSYTGFSIGNNGTLVKTTNAGTNWTLINLNLNYVLNDLKFINQQTGFLVSYYTAQILPPQYLGKLLKTTDSGSTWNPVLDYLFHLYTCYFINENIGFISAQNTTNQGRMFRTTNGGITWDLQLMPNNSITNCYYFLNSTTGYAGGRINEQWASYSLLKTTNSGLNWESVTIPSSYNFAINSIYFTNSQTGYLSCLSFPFYGRAGDVYKTVDGGNTWFHQSSVSSYPTYQRIGLNSIYFLNDNTGFIVGELGTILKTTDGGNIISIEPISSKISKSFSLRQNYPNPFNPVTKIKFDIPKRHLPLKGGDKVGVVLIIYDYLGREVTTLVNEQLQPGSYSVDWDASGYASGVYFYSLVTDGFTETKRMVLLK